MDIVRAGDKMAAAAASATAAAAAAAAAAADCRKSFEMIETERESIENTQQQQQNRFQ